MNADPCFHHDLFQLVTVPFFVPLLFHGPRPTSPTTVQAELELGRDPEFPREFPRGGSEREALLGLFPAPGNEGPGLGWGHRSRREPSFSRFSQCLGRVCLFAQDCLSLCQSGQTFHFCSESSGVLGELAKLCFY